MTQPATVTPVQQDIYFAYECPETGTTSIHAYSESPLKGEIQVYDINAQADESANCFSTKIARFVVKHINENFQISELSNDSLGEKTISELSALLSNEDQNTHFLFCKICQRLEVVQYE